MRILFALPGLHRFDRGAEVAFISVAKELAKAGDTVTLIGSGAERAGAPYRYLEARCISREHFRSFPSMPVFRNDCVYEELTFVPDLIRRYRPADYDFTLTCSYPFTNWILRCPAWRESRPRHVFVTQNGDWPAYSDRSEYRLFGCDGLICTNPDFYNRNRERWHSCLIPNGVDCDRFKPGSAQRNKFGLPNDKLIVLMVSALIESKRVAKGIEAVSLLPNAHLVVAGAGQLQHKLECAARELLGDRFTLLSIPAEDMPSLYRSADVFLHLSKEEAFGNVFVEAMACGLPIVAEDSPRTRWIVGNDHFLVNTESREAIVDAIDAAVQTPETKRLESAQRSTRFSWSEIGMKYRDFLQQLGRRHALHLKP
jgi:glycosyltransferase involved in cell wall biosynthesis